MDRFSNGNVFPTRSSTKQFTRSFPTGVQEIAQDARHGSAHGNKTNLVQNVAVAGIAQHSGVDTEKEITGDTDNQFEKTLQKRRCVEQEGRTRRIRRNGVGK